MKSSWHVADPYTSRYSTWHLNHLVGRAGTDGRWDQRLYRYGIRWAACCFCGAAVGDGSCVRDCVAVSSMMQE